MVYFPSLYAFLYCIFLQHERTIIYVGDYNQCRETNERDKSNQQDIHKGRRTTDLLLSSQFQLVNMYLANEILCYHLRKIITKRPFFF